MSEFEKKMTQKSLKTVTAKNQTILNQSVNWFSPLGRLVKILQCPIKAFQCIAIYPKMYTIPQNRRLGTQNIIFFNQILVVAL